jgi:hypothetical protein
LAQGVLSRWLVAFIVDGYGGAGFGKGQGCGLPDTAGAAGDQYGFIGKSHGVRMVLIVLLVSLYYDLKL